MVDPLSTRDLIKRLGTFLADLTTDRPAARIHADILERLRETWQEPDPQLSGIYFEDKDFTSVWTAIRNGASLPINSWDTVVLPVIVYYSTKEKLKPNLETAIHLWGQARTSLSNVLEGPSPAPIVPVYEVVTEQTLDTLALPPSTPIPPERVPTPRRRPSRARKRWLVAAMVSVLVVLAAVGVVLYGNATKEPYAGTLPRNITTGQPSTQPSTSSSPTESPTASPTADPSMLPPTMTPSPLPPGVVAPTAPRGLASTGKTQTTATLSWQPPANAGTGGLSRYRVFKGMAEIGTALGTTFTATGLAPKTTYGFSVLAVNHAGASSPPSNSVAVTTDPTPPPSPPDAKVWIAPGSEVSYGLAFAIVGGSWPCTAMAQIDIYMANMLIAKASTDANGRFEVWPEIITEPTHAKIPVLDPAGDYLVLQRDKPEPVRAVLVSQPQCSATAVRTTTVTFVSPE